MSFNKTSPSFIMVRHGPSMGSPATFQMGLCFPCPGESAPPWSDLKEKRAKFAEAAERRQEEAACWDILDIQAKEVEKEKEKKHRKTNCCIWPLSEGEHGWTVS